MTLDEAIYHAREVAEKNYKVGMLCHANPDDEELDVYCECAKDHLQLAEWLEDYKRLKLLEEENQSAAGKQIAKRPYYEGDGYDPEGELIYDTWRCPNCGEAYEVDYDEYDYCPNCGQRIDWSDEE